MNISKTTGKAFGKLVSVTKAAPKGTVSRVKNVKNNIAEGYREVVPAKTENS